ncbi:hypothetical protein V9L05_15540 [Bernardetia sp. Wsw4-3y2]|uniref:hypothetical protein n=1 Tax=Bernardetia sp. Wsw4-3y2 TaxID=3127471 RepID=UPI0030D36E2B
MNTAPLELSHSLLQTIESLFIENNISKYFKDTLVVLLVVLFFPILYLASWMIALIIYCITYKILSKEINFTNAKEYRQSRIVYDLVLPVATENTTLFKKLKEKDKIWYFIFYPVRIIYLPAEWYCREVKKEFEKLDSPNKKDSLFRSISEEELWERRTKAYQYKL